MLDSGVLKSASFAGADVPVADVPESLGVSGSCAEPPLDVGAVLASVEAEADGSAAEGRQLPVGVGGLHIACYQRF